MPSSSMSEPCSIERTPARIATLMPSVPWAWAATNSPCRAASSTAARTIGSDSSTTPGCVPRVSTAPVTMHLMSVAPPSTRIRTFSRTSSRRLDDPEPQLRRQAERRRVAGHLAATARRRDVGAGALHPRAGRPAAVDGVAQRDVDERAVRADVADRREPGPQRRRGVADAAHRLLGRRGVDGRDAGVLELADQVAVAIDEPRHDPVAGERDRLGIGGRRVVRAQDRLDPLVGDEEAPVGRATSRRRRRAGAGRRSGGGRRPWSERSRATIRGMTTTLESTALHRRRRRRPPARRRPARPAHRLRARPAGHRPEGVQRPRRAPAPHRPPGRGADRGDGPGRARRGLPQAAGPAPVPGLDGRQGPGAVPGHRRRLRQRRRAASGPRRRRARTSRRACWACPASAR